MVKKNDCVLYFIDTKETLEYNLQSYLEAPSEHYFSGNVILITNAFKEQSDE